MRAMRPRLPTTVTFAAPSKMVGGPEGDSTHRGAALWPVPRGSTILKSGPAHPSSDRIYVLDKVALERGWGARVGEYFDAHNLNFR